MRRIPLALPSFGALLCALALVGCASNTSLDTTRASNYKSQTISFQYPSYWRIDEEDRFHDPDHQVSIAATGYDHWGWIQLMIYSSDLPLAMEFEKSTAMSTRGSSEVKSLRTLDHWGNLEGVGEEFVVYHKGRPGRVVVFLSALPDGSLFEVQIYQIATLESVEKLRPGIEMLARSLRVDVSATAKAPERPERGGAPRAPGS